MLGLYIHVPFCVQKCIYCDFPSYGGVIDRFGPSYVEALCREIAATPAQGQTADTIYLGGGTPSLLTPKQLEQILKSLRQRFAITADAEITVEANPESMNKTYAMALASLGVNRVSLGFQSTNDDMLRFLGRVHTVAQGIQAVHDVYRSGIENISVDFMYGLPGQTLAMVQHDMETLVSLPIRHASIYSLIVEEGTKLKRLVDQEEAFLPADDRVEEMANLVHEQMHQAGFQHYEISSYCKPGYASRHNLKYWQYTPYIGFGASAHSFAGMTRWANTRSLPQYITKAGTESVRAETVSIDDKRAVEDFCFLALRMRSGIESKRFLTRFGRSIETEFGSILTHLMTQGLIEKMPYGYRLTDLGLSYGNYVFSQFIR